MPFYRVTIIISCGCVYVIAFSWVFLRNFIINSSLSIFKFFSHVKRKESSKFETLQRNNTIFVKQRVKMFFLRPETSENNTSAWILLFILTENSSFFLAHFSPHSLSPNLCPLFWRNYEKMRGKKLKHENRIEKSFFIAPSENHVMRKVLLLCLNSKRRLWEGKIRGKWDDWYGVRSNVPFKLSSTSQLLLRVQSLFTCSSRFSL
jgi:hypothetical protein